MTPGKLWQVSLREKFSVEFLEEDEMKPRVNKYNVT